MSVSVSVSAIIIIILLVLVVLFVRSWYSTLLVKRERRSIGFVKACLHLVPAEGQG